MFRAVLQSEAVGSERESGLGSAWSVVCSEGDASAGGGGEAAAGAGEGPAVPVAGSGEKHNRPLFNLTPGFCLLLLSDPDSPRQAESSNKELSLQLSRLQSEEVALRDSLSKMGNMNEALAQDKAALNTYILQVI